MELIIAIAIVCTTAWIIGIAIVAGILTAIASIKQDIAARRDDQPIINPAPPTYDPPGWPPQDYMDSLKKDTRL